MARTAWWAAGFVLSYALVLIGVSLLSPRRILEPGERRCYDDWCVTALSAQQSSSGTWVATLEVWSVAKRITQSAPDATADMEDTSGRVFAPDAPPEPSMSRLLGPGERFRVQVPFRLPVGARPAGLQFLHHAGGPGIVVIGDDNSFLHQPALAKLAVLSE